MNYSIHKQGEVSLQFVRTSKDRVLATQGGRISLSVVSDLPGNPRLSTLTQSLKQNCSDVTQIHGIRHGNYSLKYSNEMNTLKFTVVRIT